MKWRVVLLVTAAVLMGCNSSPQVTDPFRAFGRNRIPPPATGSIGTPVPPPNNYYQPPAQPRAAPGQFNPSTPGSSTRFPPATGGVPQSGFGSSGVAPAVGNGWVSSAGRSTVALAAHQTPAGASEGAIRIADPVVTRSDIRVATRGMPVNDATVNAAPPRQLMEITRLPAGAVSMPTPSPRRPRGFPSAPHPNATTGWTAAETTFSGSPAPIAQPATAPAAPQSSTTGDLSGRYGYQPDYQWLRGLLEYASSQQRWKLRYIPYNTPPSQIDRHGGSVVLASTTLLAGYKPGDFVAVQGQLGQKDPASADFAPVYHLHRVTRLQ